MQSRLPVVLVSLLLATPTVMFWLWLVIPPRRWAVPCPEECLCFESGYNVDCAGSGLNSIPPILPKNVGTLKLDDNNVTIFVNDSFVSRGLVSQVILSADFCKIRRIELGAFNGLTNLT
jgi:hypothetical protein